MRQTKFDMPRGTDDTRPRRRERSDKNKETDAMPELEEFQAVDANQPQVSAQDMTERIESLPHGHVVIKQPAEPQEHATEKNVVDMQDTSKVMAEGILPYVKTVVTGESRY
ncbi:hypothetical protein F511_29034 [Dorcoceras hygrometricum]|uniref:Uncharacterized protein n=1 Tax=Dorcoceras hygrometricum TaxID=472368 RepID=A0A2Z7CYA9_9LAMI|nr:hypothetical protein F511_29034 [Dorcoceras hygrometricum]